MNPTHTPTEPGCYYWRRDNTRDWEFVRIYNSCGRGLTCFGFDWEHYVPIEKLGGEWLGKVPEPGATFTVGEIYKWTNYCERIGIEPGYNVSDYEVGIAATTQRNKEKRT